MAETIVVRKRYRWPEVQLNIWVILFLASSAVITGIFGYFITVQQQLQDGIPWYFPYNITIGSLGLLFLLLMIYLMSQRALLPGIMVIGSFILFVLWLTGLIKTSIVLWGPQGSVNDNCVRYVSGQVFSGQSVNTLAWLEQNNICQCWKAGFSFLLIGTVLLLWMMVMAWQVQRDDFD
ncbi:MAG: hypothetical protein M1824_002416 [Vezdaea acicularis]|nr:MAG: hypothetical protein M1824_002416 [Vezdaea acicularis]